jgi:hypothetical protein
VLKWDRETATIKFSKRNNVYYPFTLSSAQSGRRPCFAFCPGVGGVHHRLQSDWSFGSDRIKTEALDSCFDAFSSREPASTSLENALKSAQKAPLIVNAFLTLSAVTK